MSKWIIFLSALIAPFLAHAEMETTLSIIKPDAVKKQHIGEIISHFEKNGLKIAAIKMLQLTPEKAGEFYKEHQGKSFFNDLSSFMTSGPIVVMVLSGDDAVAKNRKLMGATDFKKAQSGTLRSNFGSSITENAVHGSDSTISAKQEIEFFFTPNEILNP